MSSADNLKTHECSMCARTFLNTGNLKQHLQMHTGKFSHYCNVCFMGFPAASHLVKHMRIHTGQRPYGCTICDRRFVEGNTVKKHIKAHSGTGSLYKCTVCQQDFKRPTLLLHHMKSHTEATFNCVICQNGFLHPGHLSESDMIGVYKDDRKKRPDPTRPFVCDTCKRTFPTAVDHRRHIKIHVGKEPYACTVCFNRFINKETRITDIKAGKS